MLDGRTLYAIFIFSKEDNMDNGAQGKVLFNLQRFLIIQTKLNPQTSNQIPNEYAYAWYVKMYPLSNDGEWHEDLEQYFDIRKNTVEIISKYIIDECSKNRYYTFRELESHFKKDGQLLDVHIRSALHCVLRYYYLKGEFSQELWTKLLESENHPIEAKSIIRNFESDDICFI